MPDLITLLKRAGFRGESLRTMWAIVQKESGGNPRAYNPNASTGDQSYGLAQINMLGALGPARRKQFGIKTNEQLFDPLTNLRAAYRLSGKGTDFGAWGVGPNAYRDDSARFNAALKKFPKNANVWKPVSLRAAVSAGGGQTVRQTQLRGPTPAIRNVRKPAFTMKQLDGLARKMGFKSFAKAFSLDDNGKMMGMLRDALAAQTPRQRQIPRVGPQQLPVVSTLPAGQKVSPLAQRAVKLAHRYLGQKYVTTGGLREMFYDPLGAYDEGNWISPIGGHSDHVHFSFGTSQAALETIRQAQQMGLRATENPYAEGSMPEAGVHTPSSYHYQYFPGEYDGRQLGRGLDVSGDPELLAALYKWARRRYIS